MNRTEFNYVIERHYGTVSVNNDYSKELCRIRWKNGSPKLDFRLWRDFSDEGKRTPMKGISISLEEAETLKGLLNNAF
mgnify:CR=1 FL=1